MKPTDVNEERYSICIEGGVKPARAVVIALCEDNRAVGIKACSCGLHVERVKQQELGL
jgi:hypothetical protein